MGDEDLDLQAAMHRYWTRFAATGDPNDGSDPMWPAFETATDQHMLLVTAPAAGESYLASECDFWDGIAPSVVL